MFVLKSKLSYSENYPLWIR